MAGRKGWTWAPDRRKKPKVADEVKAEVQRKADELVEKHLKPKCVKPPPEEKKWNYLTGIHTKWHGAFFYFIGDWASPGPHAISPRFEAPFAGREYARGGKFNVAYSRHPGQFWQVYEGLTLVQALEGVRKEHIFHPPC